MIKTRKIARQLRDELAELHNRASTTKDKMALMRLRGRLTILLWNLEDELRQNENGEIVVSNWLKKHLKI